MPTLLRRGSLAAVAFSATLFSSTIASAQHRPLRESRGWLNQLVTGSAFEIIDERKAERRLAHLEGKLDRDAASGDPAAVDRDLWHIDKTRYRIGVDRWLAHYNLCQQLGPYPEPIRIDCITEHTLNFYHAPVRLR